MSRQVDSTLRGAVLDVVLNRPERRNALSRQMLVQLCDVLRDAGSRVSGVVISGSSSTFSAGADIAELDGTAADETYDDAVAEVVELITRFSGVVVAAIDGACIGAAVDLALACDVRIAGTDAFLEVPAARLGLLYNPVAVRRMWQQLPPDTLRRLLLLGERFDAEAAHRAGLFSIVVPVGMAAPHARELLAELPQTSEAVTTTKAMLHALDSGDLDTERWQQRRRALLESPARQAALELAKKRHPHTQGRIP